jgi:hypothetical protein
MMNLIFPPQFSRATRRGGGAMIGRVSRATVTAAGAALVLLATGTV